jgi:redox-sensitive bicupin YhaK (pirin superfamily)
VITVRKSEDRGHARHGWLDSRHTFSFGEYHDPEHMGFRALRVINEDRVAPGSGFPTHGHRDMEIVTYVLSGAIEHADSLGTGAVLRPGEIQRMSAGTGVAHSEFNPSPSDPLHFLQIWVLPERRGLAPEYEQKLFADEGRRGRLQLLASRDGRDGAASIHQDVDLYRASLDRGARIEHALRPGRHAWVQVVSGSLAANRVELSRGDGAALSSETTLSLEGRDDAELLLFDLA